MFSFLLLLRYVLFFLILPFSLISTTYLYYYPIFHRCAFPTTATADSSSSSSSISDNDFLRTLLSHTPFASAVSTATTTPPFRLLAIGDPQIEGNTSLDPTATSFTHLHALLAAFKPSDPDSDSNFSLLQRIRAALHANIDFWLDDLPRIARYGVKRLDLWGNDYYLAHVYRTMRWWSRPTHVTVLGDLLGSQWIEDDEFDKRAARFWDRVFPNHEKIHDNLIHTTVPPVTDADATPDTDQSSPRDPPVHIIGDDALAWSTRLMNVAGNHDIGYAGDLTFQRAARFERAFGRLNYALEFQLPSPNTTFPTDPNVPPHTSQEQHPPAIRIVVLNNMNLDTPAYTPALQTQTYDFINAAIKTSYPVTHPSTFTILLTHIPLHKPAGTCTDAPFFDFHPPPTEPYDFPHGVKSQNHLSPYASHSVILESLFGKSGNPSATAAGRGRSGIILTGHDHTGCDVYHFINQSHHLSLSDSDSHPYDENHHPPLAPPPPPQPTWDALPYASARAQHIPQDPSLPGLREVTVRSVMGDYGGNVALVSAWLGADGEWRSEVENCGAVRAWVWWVVHIVDCIAGVIVVVWGVLEVWEGGKSGVGRAGENNNSSGSYKTMGGKIDIPTITTGSDESITTSSATLLLSPSQKKSLRRKRSKQTLKDDLGAGRRQLSAVL